MTLEIQEEVPVSFSFDHRQVAEDVVAAALTYENFPYEAELGLTLTDDASIRRINQEFRSKDAATDVLSFPLLPLPAGGCFETLEQIEDCFHPETGEALLGDIVISVDHVKEQAKAYGHSQIREYAFLIAHSMLHLMGYDHEDPKEADIMEQKQNDILDGLNITREEVE